MKEPKRPGTGLRRSVSLLAAACWLATTSGCAEGSLPASISATTADPSVTTAAVSTTGIPMTDAATSSTTVGEVPPENGPSASTYRTAPSLLLAHDGGINLWAPGSSVSVYEGTPVVVALPDLMGGAIFQESDELYVLHGTPPSIKWVPVPGAPPRVLVEARQASDFQPAVLVTPVQVVEIGGDPTLLYRRWEELPSHCAEADAECRWASQVEYLVLRDLVTGTEQIAGAIGAFESNAVGFQLGGDRAAVTMSCYGGGGACAGVVDRVALLAGMGLDPPPWIGEGSPLLDACTLGPTPSCLGQWSGEVRAALAPDGSLLAYVERWEDPATGQKRAPELVIFDPATDTQVRRLVIGPSSTAPGPMVFDGRWVAMVLYDDDSGPVDAAGTRPADTVLISPAGEILPLPPGRPSLWQVVGAPTSYFATAADLAASLNLPCDHWDVGQESPHGETALYCRAGDGLPVQAVLFSDPTGYYLTQPGLVRDNLVHTLTETPESACEDYGSQPFLAGINWWLYGWQYDGWNPGDLKAAADSLGASYIEGIDCY